MIPDIEKLAPGTPIGACVVEDVLSTGGFGVIYRGKRADDQPVAIKVGKVPAHALTAQQLVWQQNEIEALTRLKHPSLVDVQGFGFLPDGRIYLVMELVRGTVLGEYLAAKGPLEALEAIRLMRVVAEALAYCHEHMVLHL